MIRVALTPDGGVGAVLVDGVTQAVFEVATPDVEVASTCKYCTAPITATEEYWTRGEEFADWYSDDDSCCAPSCQRPHEPGEVTITHRDPYVETVRT